MYKVPSAQAQSKVGVRASDETDATASSELEKRSVAPTMCHGPGQYAPGVSTRDIIYSPMCTSEHGRRGQAPEFAQLPLEYAPFNVNAVVMSLNDDARVADQLEVDPTQVVLETMTKTDQENLTDSKVVLLDSSHKWAYQETPCPSA